MNREEYIRDLIQPEIEQGLAFPILPKHHVYVRAPIRKQAGHRFAYLFRQTWDELRKRDRKVNLDYWHGSQYDESDLNYLVTRCSPQIDVRHYWKGGPKEGGFVHRKGHWLGLMQCIFPRCRTKPIAT